MLNEYEINKINNLEPYFRQENIDIFYNQRMKKIREFSQEPVKDDKAFVAAPPKNMFQQINKYKYPQNREYPSIFSLT